MDPRDTLDRRPKETPTVTALLPFMMAFGLACSPSDGDSGGHEHHHTGGSTIPDDANFSGTATTDGGTWTVTYSTRPEPIALSENFDLTVTVTDAEGPARNAALELAATMPDHNHGMNTDPTVTTHEDGTFTVQGMQFHMTGWWRIHADVSTPDLPSESAWFDVTCCD